jgi:uncharacterized membrane protein YhaH (DUF805 family)
MGPLKSLRAVYRDSALSVHQRRDEDSQMMFLVVLLIVLWFLGVITKYTLGGLLHILLVMAIVFLLIGVIRGRGV